MLQSGGCGIFKDEMWALRGEILAAVSLNHPHTKLSIRRDYKYK